MSQDVTPIIASLIEALTDNYISGERQADIVATVATTALGGGMVIDDSVTDNQSEWISLAIVRARSAAERYEDDPETAPTGDETAPAPTEAPEDPEPADRPHPGQSEASRHWERNKGRRGK